MIKGSATITVEGKNQQEVKNTINAMITIKRILGNEDTIGLAQNLKEKPSLVKMAKKMFSND